MANPLPPLVAADALPILIGSASVANPLPAVAAAGALPAHLDLIPLIACASSIALELANALPASALLMPRLTHDGKLKLPDSVASKSFANQFNIIKHAEEDLALMHDPRISHSLKTRLLSFRQKHARQYRTMLPITSQLKISNRLARFDARDILDLFPYDALPTHCRFCGGFMAPGHPHCCPSTRRGGVTRRHDLILKTMVRNCLLGGIDAIIEPRLPGVNRIKPDARFSFPGVDPYLFTDVSIIYPLAPTYARQSIEAQLSARSTTKHNKYNARCVADGNEFLAFPLSSYGNFGKAAQQVITRLAQHASDSSFATSVNSFSRNLYNELLVALHTGNAQILEESWKGAF